MLQQHLTINTSNDQRLFPPATFGNVHTGSCWGAGSVLPFQALVAAPAAYGGVHEDISWGSSNLRTLGGLWPFGCRDLASLVQVSVGVYVRILNGNDRFVIY